MQTFEQQKEIILKQFKQFESNSLIKHMLISAQSVDGDFRVDYNYGVRNKAGDLVNQNTPFMIASITKMFIATTILRLYELGKIDIYHPISQYLDEALIKGIHVFKGIESHQMITIKHLLSHTSGILDYIEIKDENKKTIFDRIIYEGDCEFDIPQMLDIVKKARGAYFAVQPLEGKKLKARYSDTNFQLLRAIIRKVTDDSCEAAFNQYIFKRLDMQHSFLPSNKDTKPYTDVASLWSMDLVIDRPLALRSFGDYYSTKDDLFRFMKGLLKLQLFEKQKTLDLMLHDFNTFSLSFSPVAPAWPIAYSMGMIRFDMPILLSGFKRMPTVYGHTGVGSAFLFYVPKLDMMFCGTVGQVRHTALPFRIMPRLLIQLDNLNSKKE